jgi:hypothetical protein
MTQPKTAPEGAICKVCKKGMLVAEGCIMITVPIYGTPEVRGKNRRPLKVLDPVKYGDEIRFRGLVSAEANAEANKGRCHDCGALPGNYHHPGCDWEECPNCHGQMLFCGGECGAPN